MSPYVETEYPAVVVGCDCTPQSYSMRVHYQQSVEEEEEEEEETEEEEEKKEEGVMVKCVGKC